MFVFSDLHDLVHFLLDKGADPNATGTVHLKSSYSNLSYPNKRMISNMESSRGGFGAGDDIFPLVAVVATAYNRNENVMVLRKLLSAGADVNQRTAIGQTALHVLCTTADCDCETDEFSLDVDYPSDETETEAMKALIDHGADVNISDDFGKSPLHYAAHFGKKYFAQLLLKSGADVYLKDKLGLTALDYAAMQDHLLTAALIDKYNYSVHQVIQAYECVAIKAPSSLELLRKATLLREEHNIPKLVLAPLECYGFLKEWETNEELEAYEDDDIELYLMCLLARERISKDISFDLSHGEIPGCEYSYWSFFCFIKFDRVDL